MWGRSRTVTRAQARAEIESRRAPETHTAPESARPNPTQSPGTHRASVPRRPSNHCDSTRTPHHTPVCYDHIPGQSRHEHPSPFFLLPDATPSLHGQEILCAQSAEMLPLPYKVARSTLVNSEAEMHRTPFHSNHTPPPWSHHPLESTHRQFRLADVYLPQVTTCAPPFSFSCPVDPINQFATILAVKPTS